jgi:pimeloyl-ACP methyl ester carboxylesterase
MANRSSASHTRSLAFAPILFSLLLSGCVGPEFPDAMRQTLTAPRPPAQTSHPTDTQAATARTGPLLVVMSYGFGCAGSGAGNGLRAVADEIRKRHPEQQVITRGWNDNDAIEETIRNHAGPVALIGHSFGGSQSVEMAAHAGRPIDWLVLLDPVPSDDWAIRHFGKYFELPPGVLNAACFLRSGGGWPVSYPITNPLTPSDNRPRSMGHSAFCADAEVREYVLNVSDQEAALERHASRPAQQPGSGGQQAADDRHRDQVGNEVRDQHERQTSAQRNHPAGLLAVHEHPHADGAKRE